MSCWPADCIDQTPSCFHFCSLRDAARDLGARSVGLVAPYLPYLRQDKRFAPGEAITSRTFAGVISRHFDWLVTVDPHLHRYPTLSAVYSIRTGVVHAAAAMGRWIHDNVDSPLVVGPDSESEQWASVVAAAAGAPLVMLEKRRSGNRYVEVRVPDIERWRDITCDTIPHASNAIRVTDQRGPAVAQLITEGSTAASPATS